jgi:hypothetical protein
MLELILSGDAHFYAIVRLSLIVTFSATLIAGLMGMPLGALVALIRFPGRDAFIVVLNGSISPNWTLARFKGPNITGSLAAASRNRTHTLGVVLASPKLDHGRCSKPMP